jgi:hypothetical protein
VPRLLERLPGFSWFSILIPVRLLTNLLRWTEPAKARSFTGQSGPVPITMPLIVPRLLERLLGFSWFSVLIPVQLLTNLLRWTELAETRSFTGWTAGLVRFQ